MVMDFSLSELMLIMLSRHVLASVFYCSFRFESSFLDRAYPPIHFPISLARELITVRRPVVYFCNIVWLEFIYFMLEWNSLVINKNRRKEKVN